jgi:hypothetical protein
MTTAYVFLEETRLLFCGGKDNKNIFRAETAEINFIG